MVLVSHYLTLVADFAERMLFVDRDTGTVAWGTPSEVFASEAFRSRYGEIEGGGPPSAPRGGREAP